VEGETYSDVATIVLGDVPSAPTTLVEKVQEKSTPTSLFVSFAEVTETNGLPILTYSLEID
jgi:hypothetical protein